MRFVKASCLDFVFFSPFVQLSDCAGVRAVDDELEASLASTTEWLVTVFTKNEGAV